MAESKKGKRQQPSRQKYQSEGRRDKNKQRRIIQDQKLQEFYQIRNELMRKHKLNKGSAKRAARLVQKGIDENEAVNKSDETSEKK